MKTINLALIVAVGFSLCGCAGSDGQLQSRTINKSSNETAVAPQKTAPLTDHWNYAAKTATKPNRPAVGDAVAAPLKLLRITANVDGSGRIIFTKDSVRYEHKNWSPPTDVTFDGEAWPKLDQTPAGWRAMSQPLDLTKAWIVKRAGRDVIALELTPEGFDLYLCDSPNGSADYEVTIAIPRR